VPTEIGRGADAGYVAILVAAFVVGAVIRRRVAEPLPLPRWQRWTVVLGAVIGGAIGAKIPFAVMNPASAVDGSLWLSDGRTITFGLVGGYLGVELAKWSAGVKAKTGDSFAVPLAVTVGLSRFGCLYAGCCYGAPSRVPWAFDLGDGIPRHPVQLYEAAFHLGAAVLLYRLGRAGRFERQRVKLYFLGYFVFRFFEELVRPEPRLALGLTLYQWATLAFVPLFLILYWLDAEPQEQTKRRRTIS